MPTKILIVEDNPASLKLMAEVLETAGMEVLRAESAETALEMLAAFPADVVLADIMLPGIDGLTLTRKLKANPATATIPIVAMTASAVCDQKLAQDAGCETLLSKPINTRTLAQVLVEIVRCAVHLQDLAAGKRPTATAPRDPEGLPLEVLVIEDDPSSLKLTAAVLMKSGYVVSVAACAEQAMATLEMHRPDVIVLDLSLPTTNGLTFVRLLRQTPACADIPVLAVTAYPQQFERKSVFAAGCDAFVVKPIDTRRLAGQVADLHAAGEKRTRT